MKLGKYLKHYLFLSPFLSQLTSHSSLYLHLLFSARLQFHHHRAAMSKYWIYLFVSFPQLYIGARQRAIFILTKLIIGLRWTGLCIHKTIRPEVDSELRKNSGEDSPDLRGARRRMEWNFNFSNSILFSFGLERRNSL